MADVEQDSRGAAPVPQASAPQRGRWAVSKAPSLLEAFDPRRNSLAMLRLLMAALVALAHALHVGFGHQPSLGSTAVADFAVDAFFVFSGFLVTRSYLRLPSAGRYAWHRFLRIMPGFWVCLLVTALLLAPLAAVLSGTSPLAVFGAAEDPAWRYVVANAGLPMLQYGIAGIGVDTVGSVFDGSLWTLQYEAFCYGVIAVLGAFALLQRRLVLAGAAVGAWVLLLLESASVIPVDVPVLDNQELFRFLLLFFLGAGATVYGQHLPISRGWALLATATVLAGTFLFDDYRAVGAVGFAYLCLYAIVRLPLWYSPRWDLSYGVYIYHWPMQLLLALAGATALGEVPFVALSIVLSLVAAALSWFLIEGPALRLKDARLRHSHHRVARGHRVPPARRVHRRA